MSGQDSPRISSEAFVTLLDLIEGNKPEIKALYESSLLHEAFVDTAFPSWLELYFWEPGRLFQLMVNSFYELSGIRIELHLSFDEQEPEDNLRMTRNVLELQAKLGEPEPDSSGLKSAKALVEFVMAFRCYTTELQCRTDFNTSIPALFEKARAGDRDSFLDLIRLDPTFLQATELRQFLALAHIQNDRSLKIAISRRFSYDTTKKKNKHRRDVLALHLMDDLGFKGAPWREWNDFLWSCGIESFATANAVLAAARRYNIEKPRAKRSTSK